MKILRVIIKNNLKKFLNENSKENDLILYHGSDSKKIFKKFYDNQFFTVNDYIASSYAYNRNGFLYKVSVKKLNPFELESNYVKLSGKTMKDEKPDKYELISKLLKDFYGEEVLNNWIRYGFYPSPSYAFHFHEKGWTPIIDWAKKNGYDSFKFIDESLDTFIKDRSYMIFDGSIPKILEIFDIHEAFESGNWDLIKKVDY
jgi:hypothetical protein